MKSIYKILCSIMILLPQMLFAQWQGAGTEQNPFKIYTLADLENITNYQQGSNISYTDVHFAIMNDIDMPLTQTLCEAFNGYIHGKGHSITLDFHNEDYYTYNTFITDLYGTIDSLTFTGNVSNFYALFINLIFNSKLSYITFNLNVMPLNVIIDNVFYVEYYGFVAANSGIIEHCINNTNLYFNVANINIASQIKLGFFVWSSNGYGKLRNCINNGNIILDVNNQTVVEIFVFSEYMTELSNCINNGDIIMNGIPAYSAITCFVDIGTKVYNCINTGNIYAKKTDVIGVFANKNGGSILNCVNTGNLTGEVKAGGIVGQSYFYNDIDIPNKIENCLNAGEIFGNESVGGIIAEFDNYVPFHNGMIIRNNIDLSKTSKYALFGQDINEYPDGLIVENNFYDKQIVTVPAMPGGDIAGKAEGKLTSELTGFALQNILGNGWSYAEGRYPIPLGFENHPAALLAATPVYLHADDAENFNTVDSVTENFTVGLENSAEWQTTTNKVFLDGENGILQSTGYEMLMCSLGNYSKNINLIIKSIPSEVPIIKSGEFSVFPNPAKDELKIENGELKINNIQITDLTGKIVLNPILIENSIDVSGLNAGIYLVKIYTDKGVAVQKIIKK